MVNKNQLFKKVWTFVVIAIFLLPSSSLLAEISAVELLISLSQKDRMSNANGYKISLVTSSKANPSDPNQGMIFGDCEVTRTAASFAMKITNHYEHPPVFGRVKSRNYGAFDYDEKGNLIVWRTLEEYVLCSPDRNDTISKLRVFFVDPNNQIIQTGDNTMLHRWPIDKPYSMYQFKYYQFPTGRGFSRHLGTVAATKSLSSGLLKVTSKGLHAPGVPGAWELVLDPNSDYLVREAIFTMEGQLRPTEIFTSSGLIEKDGMKLAKYGTYKSASGSERSIEVTDISKVVGLNKLYEEVLSRLDSPLPPGSSIVDLRGEKPVRTTVK